MASVDSFPAVAVEPEAALVERARANTLLRPELREALVAAVAACAFLVVASSVLLWLPSHRAFHLGTAALLVVALALVSRVRFEVGAVYGLSTQLVFIPMVLTLPARTLPFAVALGYLLGEAGQVARGALPLSRTPLVLLSSWYAVGPAVVLALGGDPTPSWQHWPLYLGALGALFFFDFCSMAAWSRAAYGVPLFGHLRESALPWLVDASLAPIGFLLGLRVVDEPLAILLVLPLVGLLGYFARERRQRLDHALELSHAYRGTALLLGDVIEADDAYTGTHSRAVVELAVAVCDQLGLDQTTRRDTELAALLHDIGKVRVPAALLNKPGPLDADEQVMMDQHTIEGERMLEQVGGVIGHVGHIVRSCHECWDGSGYPDRLAGEQIPLAARIICCCDAFDAMTTDRPYRAALPLAEAKAELLRNRGTHFDPTVVDALLAIV